MAGGVFQGVQEAATIGRYSVRGQVSVGLLKDVQADGVFQQGQETERSIVSGVLDCLLIRCGGDEVGDIAPLVQAEVKGGLHRRVGTALNEAGAEMLSGLESDEIGEALG